MTSFANLSLGGLDREITWPFSFVTTKNSSE